MSEGIWVAIVVLALCSFQYRKSTEKKWMTVLLPIMVVSFLSSLMLIAGGMLTASKPSIPAFRPRGEVLAFRYLAEYANSKDVVLATYSSSNALPAWAPVTVVVGQGPESVGGSELTPRINSFFRTETSDQDRITILEEQGIDYVLWGPDERKQGEWNPNEVRYLVKVYQNDDYSLFSVTHGYE